MNKRAVSLLMEHMGQGRKTRDATPHAPNDQAARFSLSYLGAFGYLEKELEGWKDITIGDIVDAIKQFQGYFGLNQSGELCVKTVRAMQMPRCGCPDIVRDHNEQARRLRDFVTANLARWTKTGLTYAIGDYLPGISKPDFESLVYNAFQAWCRLGNINVALTASNQADIIISNGRGAQSQFDGPGGTLAWAYLPDGNDRQLLMRFDVDETWALSPTSRGILLLNVATHEFGHLMGLDHSRLQTALMAPYYNPSIATPQQQDDIPRFTARYGVRQDQPPPPPPGAKPTIAIKTNGDVTVVIDGKTV